MTKIPRFQACPKCNINNPPLTLRLVDPQKYVDTIPDSRVYDLVCLNCNSVIDSFKVDNTISAVKELRDEMDKLNGEAYSNTQFVIIRR